MKITEKDRRFMRKAIQLAMKAVKTDSGGPFGVVIVKDDKIIGEGYNCVTATNDPTSHAEIVAIRNACKKLNSWQLEGCTIYSSCEPCPMCMGAIYWARPQKVFYACNRKDAAQIGFEDEFIYKEFEKSLTQRKLKLIPVMRLEALEALKFWDQKEDKKLY